MITAERMTGTYIEVVSDPHELFGGVDLISVDLINGLLSTVHQLQELGGPLIKETLDEGKVLLPK